MKPNNQLTDRQDWTDFRFGPAAEHLMRCADDGPVPKQIDLLDLFFPGLLLCEIPSDGQTKQAAEFHEDDLYIHAVRYRGSWYTSGSDRVNQIISRLYGSARSGLEKERKNASLIQRRIARALAADQQQVLNLVGYIGNLMLTFDSKKWERFLSGLADFLEACADRYRGTSEKDASAIADDADTLFPIEPAVADRLLECIVQQLEAQDVLHMAIAYAWILLGSLLRNQIWQLLAVYTSDFNLARAQDEVPDEEDLWEDPDEEDMGARLTKDEMTKKGLKEEALSLGGSNEEGLSQEGLSEEWLTEEPKNLDDDLYDPDTSYDSSLLEGTYESYYYEGDDLDRRFPGIDWYCDRCEDYLNDQPGFDDHLPVWKCTRCGYKNCIDIDNINHSEQDYRDGLPPLDPEKFYRALKERTDELDSQVERQNQADSQNKTGDGA